VTLKSKADLQQKAAEVATKIGFYRISLKNGCQTNDHLYKKPNADEKRRPSQREVQMSDYQTVHFLSGFIRWFGLPMVRPQ
jgi:hypothetical protein